VHFISGLHGSKNSDLRLGRFTLLGRVASVKLQAKNEILALTGIDILSHIQCAATWNIPG
jgi:hypothetical protein